MPAIGPTIPQAFGFDDPEVRERSADAPDLQMSPWEFGEAERDCCDRATIFRRLILSISPKLMPC
jgi:hypothetical protein